MPRKDQNCRQMKVGEITSIMKRLENQHGGIIFLMLSDGSGRLVSENTHKDLLVWPSMSRMRPNIEAVDPAERTGHAPKRI